MPPWCARRILRSRSGQWPEHFHRAVCVVATSYRYRISITRAGAGRPARRVIPPPRRHRHRYHGVLAPQAPLRAAVTAYGREVTTVDTRPLRFRRRPACPAPFEMLRLRPFPVPRG